jgi:hypothetical protein
VPVLENVRVQEANRVAFTANVPKGFEGRIRKVAVYANPDPSAGFEHARLVAVSPYSRSVPFTIECPDDAGSVRFHVTYVDADNRESRVDGDGAATIRFEKSAQGRWEIR